MSVPLDLQSISFGSTYFPKSRVNADADRNNEHLKACAYCSSGYNFRWNRTRNGNANKSKWDFCFHRCRRCRCSMLCKQITHEYLSYRHRQIHFTKNNGYRAEDSIQCAHTQHPFLYAQHQEFRTVCEIFNRPTKHLTNTHTQSHK